MTKQEEPTRVSYHHGDLDRALRAATLEILGELGPDGFTLREAARRAGVNHRAVYRHFADKLTLLAAVAEEGYRLLAAEMQIALAPLPESPEPPRLLALALAYMTFARRERARYQVMFGARINTDGRFPTLEEAAKESVRVLNHELKRLNPNAPFKVRRDAGITLWSAIHGMASLVLTGRVALAERHVATYVETVLTPVVNGIIMTMRQAK